MAGFIIKRCVQAIPVLLLLSVVVFSLLLLLPGDPVLGMLGPGATVSQEAIEQMRHDLSLDKPIPIQYLAWLGRALHGDLGRSVSSKQPVLEALAQRLPVSLQVAALAMLIGISVGVPLGIVAALKRNTIWDMIASAISIIGITMPSFWLAIILILIFAVKLHWLPASGYVSIRDDPVQGVRHLLLPAFAMGIGAAASLTRQVRSCLLEVLQEDYVRTARAKGLRERSVLMGHALRNAMIPTITILGLLFSNLVGGSLIVESIFLVPGMGSLLVNAIFTRDFPIVQGGALVIAIVVVLVNLLVDMSYAFIDPRIRLKGS
jgi:peptide/nickel transport system permease protein